MTTALVSAPVHRIEEEFTGEQPLWVIRATLLWNRRRLLLRVAAIALLASSVIAFVIPKRYKAVARIMPPEQQSTGAMMLAALASRTGGLGAIGTLAGDLLGGHSTTALLIDLLHSGTISGHLIDRFDLQHLYHSRYRVDAAKHLARRTTISDDKKSGVITLEVQDNSPTRARDLAQAYLDELNKLVNHTTTSTAHRERIFIEQRLNSVQQDLEQAEIDLSEFSSKNSTIDIKEQTRAMVDAGARVQGELLVAQSGLQSLRQIYGDSNVRVRETEARINSLQHELEKMAGSSAAPASETSLAPATDAKRGADSSSLYPQLRQLPRLAVPYADLYRRVRVQETVFELLTQQYEMARIEEAKDIPVVSVIDPPGVPEKKSFPPRLLLIAFLTAACLGLTSTWILACASWSKMSPDDPRKLLGSEVFAVLRERGRSIVLRKRGAA
ncbi:MAG: Wzz/FepE/Etk N-terminal domain-containing protein [Terracidiphilus sp.]